MRETIRKMRAKWYYVFLPMPMFLLIAAAAHGMARSDDPGPTLQYGGTPIELHYSAPGANVTKVTVDGTPCIIVSDWMEDNRAAVTIALSCNWGQR